MKNLFIKTLHFIFGYQRYLRYFTRFKIFFLKNDRRKHDFLYFEKILSEKANILVIGANTGITTIPFSKGKEERNIFAYEPLPSNFEILENCIKNYSLTNIKSYMIALGNSIGQKEMILPTINGTRKHGMAYINTSSIASLGDGKKFLIQMDKLDNRSELINNKIDAIKLVAENYETEIIKGAKNIIARDRPFIYCELWHNENRISTMELIQKYGYQIYYRKGKELLKFENSNYEGKNFFFKSNEE